MTTKEPKTIPKISVKIWCPLIEKLDAKLEAACLRRDAYLNKVLDIELAQLDAEVSIPNSQVSYDYIASRLGLLDRKLVSLAISPELATRVNEICSRKKIVRDSFFNRLFLLLAAKPATLDALLFPGNRYWRDNVWKDFVDHGDPFIQSGVNPLEALIDPFWAIRHGFELESRELKILEHVEPVTGESVKVIADPPGGVVPLPSLYSTRFHQEVAGHDLAGLNCYLPDWQVPGQQAEEAYRATLDEIFAEL